MKMSDSIGLEIERREKAMTFEEWIRQECFKAPPEHSVELAKSAWDYQQSRLEALEKDFAYHVELCTSQQARIGALTAEVEEQARLLGASGSREAELLARVEALEKKEAVLYSGYDVLIEVRKEQPNFEITHVSDVLDAVVRLQKAALLQEPTP